MSLALDQIQISNDTDLYIQSEESELDYRILAIQIIRQALWDYTKLKKIKYYYGIYNGSGISIIEDCELFLFSPSGEWKESRDTWSLMAGIDPDCFDKYLKRIKKNKGNNGKH